jgi:hypothetical protein
MYIMEGVMHKKMTITLDETVYDGLVRIIGRRKISQFIEDLARPYVTGENLEAGYKAMASDENREKEAQEWSEGLIGDSNAAR